jgi:hypothetical protein
VIEDRDEKNEHIAYPNQAALLVECIQLGLKSTGDCKKRVVQSHKNYAWIITARTV